MGPLSWTAGIYSPERIARFKDPNLQVSEVDSFVEEYKRFVAICKHSDKIRIVRQAKEGKQVEGGFPESAYRVSKAAEIALTMIQAR